MDEGKWIDEGGILMDEGEGHSETRRMLDKDEVGGARSHEVLVGKGSRNKKG